MKTLIPLLLFALCLCACDKESETTANNPSDRIDNSTSGVDGQEESPGHLWVEESYRNYIQVYLDADTVITLQTTDVFTPCPCISVNFEGMEYDYKGAGGAVNYAHKVGAEEYIFDGGIGSSPSNYITAEGKVLPIDKDEYEAEVKGNYEIFKQYAKQVGDTSFADSDKLVPFGHTVVVNRITGIDVVCNDDFDNNHKKGSSISDILTFYGSSPAFYVKRGYKWADRNYDLPKGVDYSYELVTCNAAEIADKQVEFFDYHFYLYFDQLPDNPGSYTFDVVIKFTDKELRNEVTMQF